VEQGKLKKKKIASVGDPDPDLQDPYVFGPPGSASGSISHKYGSVSGFIHHQAKIVRKSLIYDVLLLLYDFLSLENDLNVSVFRIRNRMFLLLPDPHPDPLLRGADQRIRIRIRAKMSRIPNTDVCS
jgi:hypothetical protein